MPPLSTLSFKNIGVVLRIIHSLGLNPPPKKKLNTILIVQNTFTIWQTYLHSL